MEKYMMLLVILADLFIGGSRAKWHPTVLMSSFLSRLAKRLFDEDDAPEQQRRMGMIYVCSASAVIFIAAMAITIALFTAGLWWYFVIGIIIMAFMISLRSMAEAAIEIKQCIAEGDIVRARERVGSIVLHDTDKMDASEAVRATVESIAHNTVNGAVAPLFYYFIGGIPLAVLYRAVCLMELMIAREADRYAEFGAAASKLKDVFDFIPARITALLLVISSYILQYDGRKASEIVRRDARKHHDVNGGYPEAVMAGALRIRLGGTNYYGGEDHFHEFIGDAVERLAPKHIDRAMRLLYMATILFGLLGMSITMAKQMGGLF